MWGSGSIDKSLKNNDIPRYNLTILAKYITSGEMEERPKAEIAKRIPLKLTEM